MDELHKRLTDLETILRNLDGSEPVKYDETASEWLLLTQLMNAKTYPKLELDYLIKHRIANKISRLSYSMCVGSLAPSSNSSPMHLF
jgi:hypothetical protein